jgi:alpha-beta hydrolase superfamily lysophospholipase
MGEDTVESTRHRILVPGGGNIVLDWIAPATGAPLAPAPVALFIHGFGSHRRGEKSLYFAERFAELGWGYLAFDFRGHGESEGTLRDLTLTGLLEDLTAVLDWLPARGAPRLLIGSSMGAAVAAWQLLARPLAARALAMIGPSLRFPAGMVAALAPAERETWRREGVRRFRGPWLDVELGHRLVEDAARYDAERLLRGHATPSLIFHGMADEAVPWRQSLEFTEACPFPGMRLVLVKDGEHRLTGHKPFLFETIRAWWDALGVR